MTSDERDLGLAIFQWPLTIGEARAGRASRGITGKFGSSFDTTSLRRNREARPSLYQIQLV